MGRGKRKPKKKVEVKKKVVDPDAKFQRKPWLRNEPDYFVSRFMWDAVKPNWTYDVEDLALPVAHVVLNYHSRFPPCTQEAQCKSIIQNMQHYQCKLMLYQDLAYNWYIGGDGHVYEGRGWKKHPKQQHDLSTECLEIAYMGDFPLTYEPPANMVKLFHEVVSYGIEKKYIKEEYQLHEFRLALQPIRRQM